MTQRGLLRSGIWSAFRGRSSAARPLKDVEALQNEPRPKDKGAVAPNERLKLSKEGWRAGDCRRMNSTFCARRARSLRHEPLNSEKRPGTPARLRLARLSPPR